MPVEAQIHLLEHMNLELSERVFYSELLTSIQLDGRPTIECTVSDMECYVYKFILVIRRLIYAAFEWNYLIKFHLF